jgi:3-dehydroquinate synthetase
VPITTETHGWRVTADYRYDFTITMRDNLMASGLGGLLPRPEAEKRLVVIDDHVRTLYPDVVERLLAGIPGELHVLSLGVSEDRKDQHSVTRIIDTADGFGLGRRDQLIGIGGGVTADLVGTSAALLRKGTPYALVATTLVCAIDAGIGFKRAVNWKSGGASRKNHFGSYYPAEAVFIDRTFFRTQSPDALRQGISEMLKVAIMVSPALFALLEQHGRDFIERSFRGAAAEEALRLALTQLLAQLADDPRENLLRRWPDFGHEWPLLETGYGVPHGHGVGIGMALASTLARDLGMLAAPDYDRIMTLMSGLGLRMSHALLTEIEFVTAAFAATTRTRGGSFLPLPTKIGDHAIFDTTPADLHKAARRAHLNHRSETETEEGN